LRGSDRLSVTLAGTAKVLSQHGIWGQTDEEEVRVSLPNL